ncbi:MAG: glycoside hydrolase family 172 protein [Anaerohalosphaeraceae bacterium]
MNRKIAAVVILSLSSLVSMADAAQEFTYIDLINRLTDLERISTFPDQGETCQMWSSYDRKSYYDQSTGKYVNWDSNGDGFGGAGFIRTEQDKLVLAEMEGPGCIWRIWSATPQKGHVRIYLDGAETPAVDLSFVDYFNRTQPPFNRPALVYLAASGKNNFVPIPFQKSCKIVADKNYGEFHQFTYTLYPKDTVLPTFKMNLSAEESAALDKADKMLSSCGPDFTAVRYPNAIHEKKSLTIEPGKKDQIITLSGARAITSLKLRLAGIPDDIERQRELTRQLTLSITWDDQDSPAVWCPIGDFFGTAPGINDYQSLPLGITKDCFYSNWFMPFAKQAVIAITNNGTEARKIELEISYTSLEKPIEQYARFHAKWHRNIFLPKEPERWVDWTMLTTQGKGRFVGVELHIWNPRGGWWGEGDEKFFVDGEKFPSSYGTGSEDYFGYAWSDPAFFAAPYHNQTISENNKGHISNNRWHIVDNVPFQSSFEGYIEKYWADTRPTQYSCVAYWYLDSSGKDPYTPVDVSQRLGYYIQLTYPLDIAGILVLEKPNGQVEAQGMGGYRAAKWVNDDQLWWTPEKISDKLLLAMEAPEEGNWRIQTRLTKAIDYGIVQFSLDGKKISDPIDLFNKDAVTATDEIDLGVHALKKGRNVLTVEIVGSNPAAYQRYMFGMDYLNLKKQ